MSEPLLDAWLDGDDFSAEDFARLESWLRADTAHLRTFLDAVSLQEELRASFAKPAAPRALPRPRRRLWLISAAGLAAALMLLAGIGLWFNTDLKVTLVEEQPATSSHRNSLKEVAHISGTLELAAHPYETGEGEPKYRLPIDVDGGAQGGSLRWLDNFELQLDPHTGVQFNPMNPFAPPQNVCVATLISGKTRIRHLPRPGAPANGIDTLELETPCGTLQLTHADATLTLSGMRPQPTSLVVTVSSGSVVIRTADGNRTVNAGETVTLPAR